MNVKRYVENMEQRFLVLFSGFHVGCRINRVATRFRTHPVCTLAAATLENADSSPRCARGSPPFFWGGKQSRTRARTRSTSLYSLKGRRGGARERAISDPTPTPLPLGWCEPGNVARRDRYLRFFVGSPSVLKFENRLPEEC